MQNPIRFFSIQIELLIINSKALDRPQSFIDKYEPGKRQLEYLPRTLEQEYKDNL